MISEGKLDSTAQLFLDHNLYLVGVILLFDAKHGIAADLRFRQVSVNLSTNVLSSNLFHAKYCMIEVTEGMM